MNTSGARGRPHVLMTADAVGGVWTYALDLGRGLADAGVRVTLAALGPEPNAAQSAQAAEAGVAVEALGGALDWTARDEGEVAASAARLHALTVRLRPDLLHLNSPALAAFQPFPVPVLAACHSCVKTWWAAVKGAAPLPDDLAWRAALVARGYANADALVAPSHAFAEATREAYGLSLTPHVILNGRALPLQGRGSGRGGAHGGQQDRLDGARPPSGGASHPPPRHRPPQGGRVQVLTAGRLWDEGKDVATLDRALGRAGLAAAGAGPLCGPNGQSVGLTHLTALGRLPDAELHARLAERPIFVSSSVYEPFGLAVLEAAQAGCPLVLSDIATFRELWDGAALFFPPGDDATLADLLTKLALDPDLSASQGCAARTQAARYTLKNMTKATRNLYAALSPALSQPHGVAA